MTMNTFVEQYSAAWERLDELVASVEKHGLASLTAAELDELGAAPRRARGQRREARAGQPDGG